jgi:hypothetical protein
MEREIFVDINLQFDVCLLDKQLVCKISDHLLILCFQKHYLKRAKLPQKEKRYKAFALKSG